MEPVYRYSVRCDRDTAQRIARAAKLAGQSETAFVQAHFERIFLQVAPAPDAGQRIDLASFEPAAFARAHGITVFEAKAWAVLAGDARDGLARASLTVLCERLDRDRGPVSAALATLQEVGLVTVAERTTRGTVWRVSEGRR